MVLRVDNDKGYIDLSKRCAPLSTLAHTRPPLAPPQWRSPSGARYSTRACSHTRPRRVQARERRGPRGMRGEVQQEQARALHHAPRGRDAAGGPRAPLLRHRVAPLQALRPRVRRVQAHGPRARRALGQAGGGQRGGRARHVGGDAGGEGGGHEEHPPPPHAAAAQDPRRPRNDVLPLRRRGAHQGATPALVSGAFQYLSMRLVVARTMQQSRGAHEVSLAACRRRCARRRR